MHMSKMHKSKANSVNLKQSKPSQGFFSVKMPQEHQIHIYVIMFVKVLYTTKVINYKVSIVLMINIFLKYWSILVENTQFLQQNFPPKTA